MGPHEALKFIEEVLLIKASVEIITTDDKISRKVRTDLLDYLDTLLAEYNKVVSDFEEGMEEEMNKPRSIH
jgi:hypothetical protein|tara:strand:+ start:677 stop:889 length:213 start_codon:yes stop_codon:yes gene_type:complete